MSKPVHFRRRRKTAPGEELVTQTFTLTRTTSERARRAVILLDAENQSALVDTALVDYLDRQEGGRDDRVAV